MITGLYEQDQGNAWISGFDIKNNIDKVHLLIGVCPQFDILWPDLTVEEHLLFYSRIKGNTRKIEKNKVISALESVQLLKFKNMKVKQLSGKILFLSKIDHFLLIFINFYILL